MLDVTASFTGNDLKPVKTEGLYSSLFTLERKIEARVLRIADSACVERISEYFLGHIGSPSWLTGDNFFYITTMQILTRQIFCTHKLREKIDLSSAASGGRRALNMSARVNFSL